LAAPVTALPVMSCDQRQPARQMVAPQPQETAPIPVPPAIYAASIDLSLSCVAIAPPPMPAAQPEQPPEQPQYRPQYQPEPDPAEPEDDTGKKPDDYGGASLIRAAYMPQPEPAAPPALSQAPRVATSIGMIRDDGTVIRFADEARVRPALSAGGDGRYALTIHYLPQRPGELAGRPLTEAARFVALSLNLGPVLIHQGLRCDRVSALVYSVNEREVGRTGDIALNDAETRIDLPDQFRAAETAAE
jgi:hypothetical protein